MEEKGLYPRSESVVDETDRATDVARMAERGARVEAAGAWVSNDGPFGTFRLQK